MVRYVPEPDDAAMSQGATASALSQAVPDNRRIALALAVTHEFLEKNPGTLFPAKGPGRPNPAMLLTLLTYCYGQNLLSSDEISRQTTRNSAIRYLTAGEDVQMADLRRFRRRFCRPLLACLTEFLVSSSGLSNGNAPEAEVLRLRQASAEKMANSRLTTAVFTDTALADD